jgi:hypothetical protein
MSPLIPSSPTGNPAEVDRPGPAEGTSSGNESDPRLGSFAWPPEDGTEADVGPGEAFVIEPGHDAWVVGDERHVGFEFESPSAEEYAKG